MKYKKRTREGDWGQKASPLGALLYKGPKREHKIIKVSLVRI
jgi:hypothetical protein